MAKYYDAHTHSLDNRGDTDIVSVFSVRLQQGGCIVPQEGLYSVGVHPWDVGEGGAVWDRGEMEELLGQERCIGVGECGLDRVRGGEWEGQMEVFRMQCEIAKRVQKPLILHSVRSISEVLSVSRGAGVKRVLHGYSKFSQSIANQADVYFSVGEKEVESSMMIPIDRLLLETDNSVGDIRELYERVAKERGMEVEELREVLEKNFKNIFYGTN